MEKKKHYIAIVDDHLIFGQGLSLILKENENENEEFIIKVFTGEVSFRNGLEHFMPNLTFADISLQDGDGLKIAKFLKTDFPESKVVMMSMHNQPRYIIEALKAKVDGYILKDSGKKEFVLALDTLRRGTKYFSSEVDDVIADRLSISDEEKNGIQIGNVFFSAIEIKIIQLIAEEYTQDEISSKTDLNKSTIMFHRRNIITKLGAKNTAGLIRKSIEKGIIRG